jgi:formylglycine-generating enzyme required for sulfatase activity
MGSPADERGRQAGESLPRAVSIDRSFAIAVYDTTRAEFSRFVNATGYRGKKRRCDWKAPTSRGVALNQTPRDPVVCVSWADASAYVAWLAARTGRPYRLPTEAEWEYAARAGSTSARPWGEAANSNHANTGAEICCGPAIAGHDRWLYTSPVGSFPANRFGLFDMIGNVWQWTADCGDDASDRTAGSAPAGVCHTRVVRGGGWFHAAAMARSASRAADVPDLTVADIGFRVALSL